MRKKLIQRGYEDLNTEQLILEYEKYRGKPISEFDDLDWYLTCDKFPLTEEIIRSYEEEVDWRLISFWHDMTIEFVREFEHRIDWGAMSLSPDLTKEVIGAFQDKLDWNKLSSYLSFSYELAMEHMDKVNVELLLENTRTTFTREERLELENIYELQNSFNPS